MHHDRIYIGMGANLGDPLQTLTRAAAEISRLPEVYDVRFSHLYSTSPVSEIPQPDFLNAVSSIRCGLDPYELLRHLMEIECKLGKEPKSRDAPRHLDLDILFYGNVTIDDAALTIPHPRWRQRLFVLYPLKDLIEKMILEGEEEIDLAALIQQQDHQQQKIKIYKESTDVSKQKCKKKDCCQRFSYWS